MPTIEPPSAEHRQAQKEGVRDLVGLQIGGGAGFFVGVMILIAILQRVDMTNTKLFAASMLIGMMVIIPIISAIGGVYGNYFWLKHIRKKL